MRMPLQVAIDWRLAVIVAALLHASACGRASVDRGKVGWELGFPVTEMAGRESGGSLYAYVPPEYYSRSNLEALCLRRYREAMPSAGGFVMRIFTDRERMERVQRDQISAFSAIAGESRPAAGTRRQAEDALCTCALSDPARDWRNLDPKESQAYNLWCEYAPDLARPNERKTMVLRGSTWTEGRYNERFEEVRGARGRFLFSAYDLYNTEPSGRFRTVKYLDDTTSGAYPKLLFHLRQEAGGPSAQGARFVSDEVLYAYVGWLYSVSTDGGRRWHLWDAERSLPGWRCCDSALIQAIAVLPDGKGTMKLRASSEGARTLRTTDFGQHWAEN